MTKQQKTRKRKGKDLDEIHDGLKKPRVQVKDPDLPGEGNFYCSECARYFTSQAILEAHRNTKLHKRRVKKLQDRPYSQSEAEAAGGVGSYKDYASDKKT